MVNEIAITAFHSELEKIARKKTPVERGIGIGGAAYARLRRKRKE